MAISMNLVGFTPFLEPPTVLGNPSNEIILTVLVRNFVALSVSVFTKPAHRTLIGALNPFSPTSATHQAMTCGRSGFSHRPVRRSVQLKASVFCFPLPTFHYTQPVQALQQRPDQEYFWEKINASM